MLPASNRGTGNNLGFPDVCNTVVGPATAPVPYPNVAMHAQATPFSTIVNVSMMGALNLSSKIPMTMGDEAGTAHPTIKGAGAFTAGNTVVFVEKQPAINLTCPTTGNSMNNGLGAVLVPATTNVFFTRRRATCDGPLVGQELLEGLRRELEDPSGGAVRARRVGPIGYLRIASFTANVPGALQREAATLLDAGAVKLLIDLRGNPGGDLSACVRALSSLLAPGVTLFEREDGDGDFTPVRSVDVGTRIFAPVDVVVDGWTASAAELFAGALATLGRARLIGSATYGKTTAQAVLADDIAGVAVRSVASFRFRDGSRACPIPTPR
jgi:carboxyl-terminal processing protease